MRKRFSIFGFIIKLVRTADGWQFDQFYGTAADE